MTDVLPTWIRATPKIFYALAVLDFVKNLAPLYAYLVTGRFSSVDFTYDMRPQLVGVVLSALIYASGWFAYGFFVSISLAIYDRLGDNAVTAAQGTD